MPRARTVAADEVVAPAPADGMIVAVGPRPSESLRVRAVPESLRPRWLAHVRALGGSDDAWTRSRFDALCAPYGEPHRAYHTLRHVAHVLDLCEGFGSGVGESLRLAFAAWYHDVVYDPHSPDNEARSAERASLELPRLGADAGFVARVARLILATNDHAKGGADSDDDRFLDADFAILGAPPDAYARYAAQVRREYAHVPDDAWCAGRGGFLRATLARARVFRTAEFEARYGAQARANLTAELARWSVTGA